MPLIHFDLQSLTARKLHQTHFLCFSFLLHGQEEHMYSEAVKNHNYELCVICHGNKNVWK